MLLAVDCGRCNVKVYDGHNGKVIPSIIGSGRRRDLKEVEPSDIELIYKDVHHFVGDLAIRESELPRRLMTKTKVHEQTLLLTLAAICSATTQDKIILITGLPKDQHTAKEKGKLRHLLSGRHDLIFNGRPRQLEIPVVEISFEGGGAFWAKQVDGLEHIVDAGAKTVNCVTINNKRFIDKLSFTLPYGCDTSRFSSVKDLALAIVSDISRFWDTDESIRIVGGKALELLPYIQQYYPKAYVPDEYLLANAIGYYELLEKKYAKNR